MQPIHDLVIIRHGQSEANKENIFTGWRDSPLSEAGAAEARAAGRQLKSDGYRFDIAFTSLQSRAIKTLWLALEEMDLMWIPVVKHWQLNERHYGNLQGKNKMEAVASFGKAQVQQWRRGYATRPPAVSADSPDHPKFDPRYRLVPEGELPVGESLQDVGVRMLAYWNASIVPELKAGKKVLIAAHGNSLRALLKHLEGVSDAEIEGVNLPTGVPRGYVLDERFLARQAEFLGDEAEIARRIDTVVKQTGKS